MTTTMSTACWRGDCGNCYGEIEPGTACDCPACHVSIYPVGLLRDLSTVPPAGTEADDA